MIILVNPPVTKPCEPSAGLARLAGMLEKNRVDYRIVDCNLEGLLFLLNREIVTTDTWTKRACKHLQRDLGQIYSWQTYRNFSKYKTAVSNLNRLLEVQAKQYEISISFANYEDNRFIPQQSTDLCSVFEHFRENIFYPYFKARFEKLFPDFNCSYLGISINFLNQALCAFALAGFIRQAAPQIRLIAGGGLVTTWMAHPLWNNPFTGIFDYLISGPGEEPLLQLLTGEAPVCKYTTPSFRQMPLKKYLAPGIILPYSTSTGCFWNRCTFCPEPAEKNRYLPLSGEIVDRDLSQLINQTDCELIHFCDNALSPLLLKKLVKKPPGKPWYGFVRFTEELADPDFCRQLKAAGCMMLKLGLESGDESVLAAINKGINLQTAARILENLTTAGIATYVYLLFGTPEETYFKACKTLNFVIKYAAQINYLNLAIFNLPLTSPQIKDFNLRKFYKGDLSLYMDFAHPSGWDRLSVRHFLKYEFTRQPAIRRIINRNPPYFSSNHAPLFVM